MDRREREAKALNHLRKLADEIERVARDMQARVEEDMHDVVDEDLQLVQDRRDAYAITVRNQLTREAIELCFDRSRRGNILPP